MTVLLVDWLGRGGIAQTTEAWALELTGAGVPAMVVTRPGRELGVGGATVLPAPRGSGRLRSHVAVVRHACRMIDIHRPAVVVVQNYLVPPLEAPVYRAARRVGARTVVVVHDHRLHSRVAGVHLGLRALVGRADVVVAHSSFVADAVARSTGRRDVVVVPHPVPVGMLELPRSTVLSPASGGRSLAVHFGTLQRRYKGTAVVVELADRGVPGWEFALLGRGAPDDVARAQVIPHFVESGALVDSVARSDATVLPYAFATQSGAVVLAQVLGSAVVASAVGGIPDQVEDGVTGRLIRPGADAAVWRDALVDLDDERARRELTATARARVWESHRRFVADVRRLAS